MPYTYVDGGREAGCDESGEMVCFGGMAEAELTNLHDEILAEATQKIMSIIRSLPADANGRHPEFVITSRGPLLIWVKKDLPRPGPKDPDNDSAVVRNRAEIEKLLRLKY